MSAKNILAVVLMAAGVLGLVYGQFSYTKQTHDVKLGPVEFAVKDRETVRVPAWAGIVAVAAGASLLLVGGRKS